MRRWPLLCLATSVFNVLFVTAAAQLTAKEPATAANSGNAENVAVGDLHLQNSRVYIRVGKTGLGHEHAVAGLLKSGVLHLGATEGAGQLVFDLKTFAADSDAARRYIGLSGTTDAATRQQVDANMRGPDVLDVARFPTATFAIKSAKSVPEKSRRGLPQYQLVGDFTLHGKTRPIQVVTDAEQKEGWVHLRGGFSILQSQYGIQPFTKAFGAIGVTDQLTIWGDFWIADTAATAGNSPASTGLK
ncbi:MAG: YceI family protein [Planctomycetaceae bacterium]